MTNKLWAIRKLEPKSETDARGENLYWNGSGEFGDFQLATLYTQEQYDHFNTARVPLPDSIGGAWVALSSGPVKVFEVEFDGRGTYTLGELESQGFFGEDGHELTMSEVDSMAVGQSLNFAGGAAPLGTITRLS